MAQKQKGQKIYRTMQGKQIDMDLLRKKNELTPAVGNARVNARGDELGPGGKIIRKKEDVIKDYYNTKSRPVVEETPVAKQQEAVVVEETKKASTRKTTRAQQKVEKAAEPTAAELEEFDSMDEEWVEDADGNFVPKGE
jgi:hypothetical protein